MPKDFKRVRYQRQKFPVKIYRRIMKTIDDSFATEISDIAKFRIHVLNHYYSFGVKSTLAAFKIKRPTLYKWKRTYETNHKRIISLVPKSTAPQHVRTMETNWQLVEFIKQMRQDHGNMGKSMLKPFVDAFAKEKGLPTIGETTIGKIIKRRRFTFEEKVYPQKQANRFRKLRTRKSPKVINPGFIQMDSVVVYINYEKHLFMCILDIYTKFAHVVHVENLSSTTAMHVFKAFQEINPTPIHTMQTDNGSEFLKSFHRYLEEQQIRHQFIYPRMPKMNAYIERFNRTIQEEFILRNDEIFYDHQAFAKKLTNYLYWYNYQRPHASLKYVSPMTFIQTHCLKST